MSFSDFSKIETIKSLNDFLAEKSYVEGTSASQADVSAYKAFQSKYPHFARWFNHIASYREEFDSLPAAKGSSADAAGGDDDVDLFGSEDEEEDQEVAKVREERLKQYEQKKASKGPAPPSKSIVTLDIKPWDDETNLDEMFANAIAIEMDGLKWGAHQFMEVGYGIKKLRFNIVVEDDKVSLEELQQRIEEDEDHVQSTDIAAMSKI